MLKPLKRRQFLRQMSVVAAAGTIPYSPTRVWGAGSSFSGDYLLYIQVDGGWDVTSYCDPKMNVAGAAPTNGWAETQEAQIAGNLRFAPVANNAEFFNDHYKKTMVINGINTRTNIHSAGVHVSHTGSVNSGMPNLAALYAYEANTNMVMPVMAGSHFSNGGLIVATALGSSALELVNPNLWDPANADNYRYLPEDDLALIRAFGQRRANSIVQQATSDNLLPKQKQQIMDYYQSVTADARGFERFQSYYSGLNEGKYAVSRYTNTFKTALTAFKSGLGIAADIPVKGFDSHEDHDNQFANRISLLNDAVGSAWHYAEQLGIANRLVVVLSSDFGRTPWYNRQKGKDHWPYGSTIIMKKNVNWANRTVGYTDDGHIGQPINPRTLLVDKVNGIEIEPKHVMLGLRQLLGVSESASAARFDLEVEQGFNFFNT